MTPQEIQEAKELLSLVIRHAVALQKYSNGQVRRLMAVLNRADVDIFKELQAVLDRMPAGTATSEYLESMLASVRRLNMVAYEQVGVELTDAMRALAESERDFQFRLYRNHLPVSVDLAAITAEQAWAAAYSRPFQGKMLREAIGELGEARARRIRDSVRMGFVEGRTTSQIVRDIRGTKAKGYVEGFVEVDRRHLETMVRTALSHTASGVRDKFFEENSDVIESQMWISTLDGRTSEPCIARSGKRYTIGERPKPIGHQVPWCTANGCGPGRIHWNAIAAGTLVLTDGGYRRVESIRVGNLVVTHTGALKTVLDVRSKSNESGVIRAVYTKSGRVLRATHEHPVGTAAGWKFVGALEVGDELLCDFEDEGEVFLGGETICPESKDGPSVGDDARIALFRSLGLHPAAMRLECDLEIGASEVEDRCALLMLWDPSLSALDESGKHHLFAAAHALKKLGRDRLADLLANLDRDASSLESHAEGSVDTPGEFGLMGKIAHARHVARIVLRHAARVLCVRFGVLFGEAPSPMALAGGGDSVTTGELVPNLRSLVTDRKVLDLGPARKGAIGKSLLPLDLPEGLAVGDVLQGEQRAVVGERFRHDRVIALQLQDYNSTVFDLEVEEDASYVASGIVVSNCRSTAIALLPGQTKLYGQRASASGPVDANLTYGAWLKDQPAGVQDEVLGATRAALFRKGGLEIDRFMNDRGQWYSIDDLRRANEKAFERAGVN